MDNLPQRWKINLLDGFVWSAIYFFQWIFGQCISHDKATGIGTNDKHVIGGQFAESLMLLTP
jgi:hypothetical protein